MNTPDTTDPSSDTTDSAFSKPERGLGTYLGDPGIVITWNCQLCGFSNTVLRHAPSLFCKSCSRGGWEGLYDHHDPYATQVCHTDYGLGVVATKAIQPRTCIETCPVWLIPPAAYEDPKFSGAPLFPKPGEPTTLKQMLYPWIDGVTRMLPTGNATLYNHSWEPNVTYWYREDPITGRYFLDWYTLRKISAGEELFVCYGPAVWFPPYTNPKTPPSDAKYGVPGAMVIRRKRRV